MAEAAGGGYATATDLADYLVRKGIPFRKAHEVTGRVVRYCVDSNRELPSLTLEELKGFHPSFEKDIYGYIDPRRSVSARNIQGGTAPARVRRRLREIEKIVSKGMEKRGRKKGGAR
jgi:argininosuccinate lyase